MLRIIPPTEAFDWIPSEASEAGRIVTRIYESTNIDLAEYDRIKPNSLIRVKIRDS